ncbi:MAG: hypothetical protein GEU93_19865 [Propionibacteriales bacterium]|nr:hypothetical protein [Propionibacteriales bacterium]
MMNRPDQAGRLPRRPLGLIPATRRSRLLYAWGLATFVLTMLPVWDAIANDARIVGSILPLTILWSYGTFTLVNLLAIAIYVLEARPWAQTVEANPQLVTRHPHMSRREEAFAGLVRHDHDGRDHEES